MKRTTASPRERMSARALVLLGLSMAVAAANAQAQTHDGAGAEEPAADVGTMTFSANGVVFHNAIPSLHAIFIKDGAYVPQASTLASLSGGTLHNDFASGVRITSGADRLNGIYVTGKDSHYTLADASISLSGNGSDDMSGIAAGALVGGGAMLSLKHVRITTQGVISSAASATDGATLKVFDSVLIAHGAALPPGYQRRMGPGMMEPPAPLGIAGTARASVTSNHARSYFYHSTIIADGWGALSTDMANGQVYLEVNDCAIRTLKSGYATYADVGAKVVINRSSLRVASYLGIIAGDGSISLNDVSAASRGAGVMIHDVNGRTSEIAALDVRGGRLLTDGPVVLVKSANADVSLDGASIVSRSGVLLQSVLNEDANATKVNGQSVTGIRATLKRMIVVGNIVHQDKERTMSISLVDTRLQGMIEHASLALDASSRWTATANSTVTLVDSMNLAQIDAVAGVTINAVAVAGSPRTGSYRLKGGGTLNVTAG